MTTPQPGWYDDPNDSNSQRYWDGQGWTPQSQRNPIPQPTSPPLAPPKSLPPPTGSPSGAWHPPPQSGETPQRSASPIAVVGVVVVLAVVGFVVYQFVVAHHSSSAPTSSQTGAPAQSPPGATANGGETQFLSDLAADGVPSSTARPEVLVARGRQACSVLAAGKNKFAAADDLVSSSNGFFDPVTAFRIVQVAVKDLCPQQN
jgi:hypothetical protein